MVRGMKFRILIEEGLYYLSSENKGADQLRGYREAELRLCFRICKKPVFSLRGSYHRHVCVMNISDPYAYAVKPDKEVTMSTTTTTTTTADVTSGEKTEESSETTNTTTTTNLKVTDNKSMKKVRSKKGIK